MNRREALSPLRIVSLLASVICQYSVFVHISNREVTIWSLLVWMVSIILLYSAFPFVQQKFFSSKDIRSHTNIYPFVFITILLAVIVRVGLMNDIDSYHIDEYLSAYFSYSLPSWSKLDWFGVYPPLGVWICQFPVLYFAAQKLFFNIFGLTTITMRLSILPYVISIFIFLFLLAKRLYNEKVAFLALVILTLFSPDLYLSRWSLHFISSTAFFLIAAYFFVLSRQIGKKLHFGLFGFFLGLCYMTYYSSYVALPLFVLFTAFLFSIKRLGLPFLKNLTLAALIFLYTINPLIIYAKTVDNFFTQRTAQVALINGEWSPYQNIILTPSSIFEILKQQTILAIQALYIDHVGGHAGYWFGRLALFDKATFILLITGVLYLLYRITRKKDEAAFLILTIIGVTFITGMIFTIPPPAFHRTSLSFPFLALLLAVVVYKAYERLIKDGKVPAFAVLLFLLSLLLLGNVFHFKKILVEDGADDPAFPLIERDLATERVQRLYIAAFDSYSLEKVLFIRSEGKIDAITEPLDVLLKKIPHDMPSHIIVLYPDKEAVQKVIAVFPHSKIINEYDRHMLIKVQR